ncbi:hypothetical protein R3P38DRAFT_2521988 [Favolaschia claudopus]|uniref:DUF6532 domain-containing protein n=1 Tax=Favolaschia claudopus TaxID=2862362 RepID=A0AAW0BZ95_9AGAR
MKPAQRVKQEEAAPSLVPPSPSIELIPNGHGRYNLKDQPRDVVRIFHSALLYFFGDIAREHALPGIDKRTEFATNALLCAADDLSLPRIAERVNNDMDYRMALITLLTARLSTFRGNVKDAAVASLYGMYKVQNGCGDRVAGLLKGQTFIYQVKPDVRCRHLLPCPPGKPNYSKPFMHPAVGTVLAHFFKGRGNDSFGSRIENLLPRNKDTDEIELPKAMIALACTAIWSALSDWATGTHIHSDFEGSKVLDNYQTHITVLDMLAGKPAKYQEMMDFLVQAATTNSTFSGAKAATASQMQQDALAMLDIED